MICCCCFIPSQTYGKNGVTPIFRSFYRTASSTTGSWSRCTLNCAYIYHSGHYDIFLDLKDAISFLQYLLLCVYFHDFASTLCKYKLYMYVLCLTSLTDSFDDRRS